MGINGGKSTVKTVDLGAGERPVVLFYPMAYQLFQKWAAMAGKKSYEFTCLGRAIKDETGQIYVTDAYMVEHEGSSGHVDADDGDIIKLTMRLDAKGIDGPLVTTKVPVPPEEIRCWIHSHPGTGADRTFWSGTDDACINRFMTGDFLVSIVFDEEGNHPKCRIDIPAPRLQLTADIDVFIPGLTEEESKAAEEIFKAKSSKKSYVTTHHGSSFGHRGGYPQQSGYGSWEDYDFPHDRGSSRNRSSSSGSSSKTGGGARGLGSNSSGSRSTIVTKGESSRPSSKDGDKVDQAFKERIMACFGLHEDEVEPEWVTWAKDNADKFGEWSYGADVSADGPSDEDELEYAYEVKQDEDFRDLTPEELDLQEAQGAGELTPEEIDELDAERVARLEEGIGEALADELCDEVSAGANGPASDDDGVPDADTAERMDAITLGESAKLIAMGVADGQCSQATAIETLQKNHDITAEAAKTALQQHLGATP